MVQGCVVSADNVDSILDLIERGLETLEHRTAESLMPLLPSLDAQTDVSIAIPPPPKKKKQQKQWLIQ